MELRGILIPGLSMAAYEFPDVPGVLRSENPEVGDGPILEAPYTLDDVAELHVRQLEKARGPLTVVGMSMGGMIASLIATRLRHRLPRDTRFVFLVTSANTPDLPALSEERLAQWMTIRAGSYDNFVKHLSVVFSESFQRARPEAVADYFRYRSTMGNKQRATAFIRQIEAIRAFRGEDSFSRLDPKECRFLYGGGDRLLGLAHHEKLRQLAPDARHETLPDVGHMIHLERPEIFPTLFD